MSATPAASAAADPRAVYTAVESGDVARLEALLQERPELVDASDPRPSHYLRRFSPIGFAAHLGNWELVKPFLDRGVDPFAGFHINVVVPSAFGMAWDEGHFEVAARLEDWAVQGVREGQYPRRKEGESREERLAAQDRALRQAVYHGALRLARALLEAGAPADTRDAQGVRPLHLALFKGHGGAFRRPWQRRPDLRMAELLVSQGAQVDLWAACGMADYAAIDRLLRENPALLDAEPDFDRRGKYPLYIAIYARHDEVVYGLLRRGCKKGLNDAFGAAVGQGRERLSLALLAAGAEMDLGISESMDPVRTPRLYAEAQKLPGFPSMNYLLRHRRFDQIRDILNEHPERAEDAYGMGLWWGRFEAVKMALEKRGPLTPDQGIGAIHSLMRSHNRLGSFEDYLACLELVLQAGARADAVAGPELNLLSFTGDFRIPETGTPLHWVPRAVSLGRPAGSDADGTEWDDQDDAAKRVRWAETLLRHGGRLDLLDAQGRTPVDVAAACVDEGLLALYASWKAGS